jgi:hypothetical protein
MGIYLEENMSETTRIIPYKMFVGSFIPNGLLRYTGISQGAKLAWARLSQYSGENGYCYPSQKKLAEELGTSDKTIRKYVNELIQVGLIEVVKPSKRDCGSTRKTTRYYFLEHEALTHGNMCSGGGHGNTGSGAHGNMCSGAHGNTGSDKENHSKRVIQESNISKPPAEASNSSPKKLNNTGKSSPKKMTAQEKKEKAMLSYSNYREYMKLDDLGKTPVVDWTPRDFLTFFFCGLAKNTFEKDGEAKLPFWARDCKTMQRCMESYGRERLKSIIVTLFTRLEEVEEEHGKELNVDLSIFNAQWIMEKVEKVAASKKKSLRVKDRVKMAETQRLADEAARGRALELRKKLLERKDGKTES